MPHTRDAMAATDTVQVDVAPGEALSRRQYLVTSEAGLFKNGKLYAQGAQIPLDAKTAAAFLAVGDIEEIAQ